MKAVPLVPAFIESLRPYEAGRTVESVRRQYDLDRIAKLASNENPLGASPKAIDALTRTLGGLNFYPNGGLDLRAWPDEYRCDQLEARGFDDSGQRIVIARMRDGRGCRRKAGGKGDQTLVFIALVFHLVCPPG